MLNPENRTWYAEDQRAPGDFDQDEWGLAGDIELPIHAFMWMFEGFRF